GMVVGGEGEWERVRDGAGGRWGDGEIEAIADAVMDSSAEDLARPDGIQQGAFICYAIAAGERASGVIGLTPAAAPPAVRRTIGTAATLVGIALRDVQLFTAVP